MTATYTDYASYGHHGGWPSSNFGGPVSYYHEGLSTYTSDPVFSQISSYTANFNNNQRSYLHQRENYSHQHFPQPATPEPIRPLAIRRHLPGSTDPPIQKAPLPVIFLTPALPMPQSPSPINPTVQSVVQSSSVESKPQPVTRPSLTEPIREKTQPIIQPTATEPIREKSQPFIQLTATEPIREKTPPITQTTSAEHVREERQSVTQSTLTEHIREKSPPIAVPVDSNDRPIKPMKDTSVYNNPPSSSEPNQIKKPLSPLKRVPSTKGRESGSFQTPPRPAHASPQSQPDRKQSAPKPSPSPPQNHPDRLQSASKPVKSPTRHQSSRQQSATQRRSSTHSQRADLLPLPPTNSRMRNVSARRPIRLDVKTMFDTDLPTQKDRHRPILAHEGDHNDHRFSMPDIKSAPKRSLSYQEAAWATAGEKHDRRFTLARQPASDTIIYRR